MKVPRDGMSENILALMSVFTFLILFVCPGGFFMFVLPWWLGVPLAVGCGAIGPWMLWRLDIDLYGPRAVRHRPKPFTGLPPKMTDWIILRTSGGA